MARCNSCNGTGRMNMSGGAAYGQTDDFMQCPRCHGFGRVDGQLKIRGKPGRRRSVGGGSGGGLGWLLVIGLGFAAFQWLNENKQAVGEALWLYIVLPLGAIFVAIATFFLVRFLLRCGQWTVGGFLRYTFNLVLLSYLSFFFWTFSVLLVVRLIEATVSGFKGSIPVVMGGVLIVSGLTGILLTAVLARKYGSYGYAWDLLRRKRHAIPRQVVNLLRPLLYKPGGGKIGLKEWNAPFVRGFLDIQMLRLLEVRSQGLDQGQRREMMVDVFSQMNVLSGLTSAEMKALRSWNEISKHSDYHVGEIWGFLFIERFHGVGLGKHETPEIRNRLSECFQKLVSETSKPKKLARPSYIRRALVNRLWSPQLAKVASSGT